MCVRVSAPSYTNRAHLPIPARVSLPRSVGEHRGNWQHARFRSEVPLFVHWPLARLRCRYPRMGSSLARRVIQVRVVLGYVSVEPWDPTRRVFPLQGEGRRAN